MIETFPDYLVIGMVVTGGLGGIILFVLLVHFVVASKRKKITPHVRYCALSSLFCSCMFCLGAFLWRTNIIFDLNFNPATSITCDLIFGIQFGFHSLSKVFMYILFTFRLEKVFKGSVYAMNSQILFIGRAIFVIIPIVFNIGAIGLLDKFEAQTKHNNISLCTANTGISPKLSDISIIASVIGDLIFTSILVFMFVYKLRQVWYNLLTIRLMLILCGNITD